ncbi:SH3 domain-containing protein [Chishuiella sp.]|uniref:SH3 domain-containing protein n=1 Tax=Chishuiella sp. TaxID=1969467 RepID=UPI0028A61A0C|nr:SH3 domain-containing protein [Chishuiella sp.]
MNIVKKAPYNITDEGDGTKSSYDDLSSEIIKKGKKILEHRKFKFPNNLLFSETINKIYNLNINEYENNIIALRPTSIFPEVAIRGNNYILIQDADSNDDDFISSDLLFWYNSFVFYKDEISYKFLKMKYPYVLKDLVIEYGYNKDKDLVKFVFNDFDFDNKSLFHDLIFSYNMNNHKYCIRKGILDDIENIIFGGMTEDFSYVKEGNAYSNINYITKEIDNNKDNYSNPDEIIAYIYEKELRIGIVGYIQQRLDTDIKYKSFLKNNDYFGFERLKDYAEYIYEPNNNENTNFIIYDEDGYTNLREGKSTSSKIIQKINSGEEIQVLDNTGDWWLIETKTGKKGFVHKSRVKN